MLYSYARNMCRVRLLLLRLHISRTNQFTINQLIVFIILENIIEHQPCVLFHYPVEKTESQESLLPSQFCSFLRLAAKNNSHHFHKEDSFFSVGPSFFLITGEPEQGGQGGHGSTTFCRFIQANVC